MRFSPAKLTAPSHGGRPLDSNSPCRCTEEEKYKSLNVMLHLETSNSELQFYFNSIKLRSYPSYLPWTGLARYNCDLVTFVSEQASQLTAHEARSSSCKRDNVQKERRNQRNHDMHTYTLVGAAANDYSIN